METWLRNTKLGNHSLFNDNPRRSVPTTANLTLDSKKSGTVVKPYFATDRVILTPKPMTLLPEWTTVGPKRAESTSLWDHHTDSQWSVFDGVTNLWILKRKIVVPVPKHHGIREKEGGEGQTVHILSIGNWWKECTAHAPPTSSPMPIG